MNTTIPVVLVAEDDADDKLLLEMALKKNGTNAKLIFVENGEDLLKYLNREPPYGADEINFPKPSFLLLDLNMPKIDGKTALKEIKKNPDLSMLPVIVFTTSSQQEDINFTYQNGGNSFITKPLSFDELIKSIATLKTYWLQTSKLPFN